jgi:hypothetical protein
MRSRVWFVLLGFLSLAIISPTAHAFGGGFLPAGTPVSVQTTQPLDANFAEPGMSVSAIVDDPVVDGRGVIVIPRGTAATLEVVGVDRSSNMKGRDRITLMLRWLHIGGRAHPVSTSYAQLRGPSEGKKAAKKIGGGAGIGAVVGGILGGGSGAAIGAAAGGATGAAVTGSGKKDLRVPAGARLQFRLNAPTRI